MYHPPFQMWSRSYVINIKIESYFLLVVSNQLARIWSLCNKRGHSCEKWYHKFKQGVCMHLAKSVDKVESRRM